MLFEEREAIEARARHLAEEVIAAAGAVGHVHVGRLRKGVAEQPFEVVGHPRLCARYSSRSERVSTPTGFPSRATTTAFVRPVKVENTSSSVCVISTAASGGCIAAATSSWSASGFLKTRSRSVRSWSEPRSEERRVGQEWSAR